MTRAKFLKGELNNIYNLLNVSYEHADCARLEDDKRFIKIFELLMEINDKSNILRQIVKEVMLSNYKLKWRQSFTKRLKNLCVSKQQQIWG